MNSSSSFFLHSQLLYSKFSPTSNDLSLSKSQLLILEINPLSHIPFSINSLHSSFNYILHSQTLASSLDLYLQVSCHFICLVSLVLDIRLNILTCMPLTISETQFCIRIIGIITTTITFIYFDTVKIK